MIRVFKAENQHTQGDFLVHELAICEALLNQVRSIAAEHGNMSVARITLRVGPLSGAVPDLLERAFVLARAGGIAADAALIFETPPVRVRCRSCGYVSVVGPTRLVCSHCGDFHTQLLEGDELVLKRIEFMETGKESDDGVSGERACATHVDAI